MTKKDFAELKTLWDDKYKKYLAEHPDLNASDELYTLGLQKFIYSKRGELLDDESITELGTDKKKKAKLSWHNPWEAGSDNWPETVLRDDPKSVAFYHDPDLKRTWEVSHGRHKIYGPVVNVRAAMRDPHNNDKLHGVGDLIGQWPLRAVEAKKLSDDTLAGKLTDKVMSFEDPETTRKLMAWLSSTNPSENATAFPKVAPEDRTRRAIYDKLLNRHFAETAKNLKIPAYKAADIIKAFGGHVSAKDNYVRDWDALEDGEQEVPWDDIMFAKKEYTDEEKQKFRENAERSNKENAKKDKNTIQRGIWAKAAKGAAPVTGTETIDKKTGESTKRYSGDSLVYHYGPNHEPYIEVSDGKDKDGKTKHKKIYGIEAINAYKHEKQNKAKPEKEKDLSGYTSTDKALDRSYRSKGYEPEVQKQYEMNQRLKPLAKKARMMPMDKLAEILKPYEN